MPDRSTDWTAYCEQKRKERLANEREESDLDERLGDGFEMLGEDDPVDPLPPLVTGKD